jgi:ATP-dependent DNA helicase 2 subunit 2
MADKEATVYIIDVSRSMGKKHSGRKESDLDWAMRYVWDKITNTVAANRKTFNVGVFGLGTDETHNELEDDEAYQHISVLQPISQILMPDLRRLLAIIQPSKTDNRDDVSALILAINTIIKHCKQLKWKRKIVLVTNGLGHIDTDPENAKEIIKKIISDDVEFVVLGVDFDDAEYGFKEEDKPSTKARNEEFLRDLVEKSGGIFGTMAEAIDELDQPRVKLTRPTHTYRGQLRLGDPEKYDTALCIDVERYPRTMIRRPESASSFTLQSGVLGNSMASSATLAPQGDQPEGSQSNENFLANVRNMYVYNIPDPKVEGGKRQVERDELAKGYEYGRTAVHINESDENITKLETEAAMEIVGFVSSSEVSEFFTGTVRALITVSSSGTFCWNSQISSSPKRRTTKLSLPFHL